MFNFQQFSEKAAKALLEKKDPESVFLRSHSIEKILAAYDTKHKSSDLADKANYLTSFYFDIQYPGDDYDEIIEEQVVKAHDCAMCLKLYYEAELERIQDIVDAEDLDMSHSRNSSLLGGTPYGVLFNLFNVKSMNTGKSFFARQKSPARKGIMKRRLCRIK